MRTSWPLDLNAQTEAEDRQLYPGKVIEIKSQEDWEDFNIPHTHVFDSEVGVVTIGFKKDPKVMGLYCSCGHVRII